MRLAILILCYFAYGCGSTPAAESGDPKSFTDPAPPAQAKVELIEPPAPQPHPRVKRHGKPKPLPQGASTHDWTSFLGPTHNLVSTETKLLEEFPASGPTLLWEMEKGTGYTSPAIQGDRLVYLHRLGNEEIVECLHPETGESYWTFSYPTDFSDRYGYNNGPRASPLIHADRVYIYGAQGKLHCLRLDTGQVLWKRNIAAEFGVPQDFFGTATTPLIEGERLILNIGAPGGPTVAAIDVNDGKMLWGAGQDWGPSYASPIPADVHGKRRVFVFAGGESRPPTGGLISIDPATGKIDFQFPWRSSSYESVNASSPVVVGDNVMVSASYKTGAALLALKQDGSYEKQWENLDFDLHWTHAIHKDGYLYAFAGRNEPDASLMAVSLETGKAAWDEVIEWEEEVEMNGQRRTVYSTPFRGSLLSVEGRFLALGEHGHLLWLELSPEGYKVASRARLFLARESWSPLVLSRGLLYVSQNTKDFLDGSTPRLRCYDLRGK